MWTCANQSHSKIEYLPQFALADWSTQKGNSAIVCQCELAQINQTPKSNICYSSHLWTEALKKVTLLSSINANSCKSIKLQNWIFAISPVHCVGYSASLGFQSIGSHSDHRWSVAANLTGPVRPLPFWLICSQTSHPDGLWPRSIHP